MRVFVAGGAGALGRRLVPQLVARGHRAKGVFTIVDDEPAPAGQWLLDLAACA
ncbi:hypothetical protein N5079_06300 [Planotetraspora sp. A-T 1434]|uniref:hypothetical protein n=1 Tax=Planotetraspora sp. A-T 1434 TaxID=2979219 RepID=UPI0021BE0387|nr:hypothetical protein [Planotetraspora sp. A-T 1434]MCT9929828.1 hypothetical protein [Planotetraspora sp. A-T 1434]